jgi:hypothetical protein
MARTTITMMIVAPMDPAAMSRCSVVWEMGRSFWGLGGGGGKAITMVSEGSLLAKAGAVDCGSSPLRVIVMRSSGALDGIVSEGVVIAVMVGFSA